MMTEEQMRREKLYQATMFLIRAMLSQELLSEDEYAEINTIFLDKYCPVLGSILAKKA